MMYGSHKWTWRTLSGFSSHAVADHIKEASAQKTVYLLPGESLAEPFWTMLLVMGLAVLAFFMLV